MASAYLQNDRRVEAGREEAPARHGVELANVAFIICTLSGKAKASTFIILS